MNKQERIEKMAIAMCKDPVGCDFCHYCFKGEFDCDEHMFAENAIEAGYINGADFVEFLKDRIDRRCKDKGATDIHKIGVQTQLLDKVYRTITEALQEYLKGE